MPIIRRSIFLNQRERFFLRFRIMALMIPTTMSKTIVSKRMRIGIPHTPPANKGYRVVDLIFLNQAVTMMTNNTTANVVMRSGISSFA